MGIRRALYRPHPLAALPQPLGLLPCARGRLSDWRYPLRSLCSRLAPDRGGGVAGAYGSSGTGGADQRSDERASGGTLAGRIRCLGEERTALAAPAPTAAAQPAARFQHDPERAT